MRRPTPSIARPRSTSPPSGDRAMLPTRPVRCRRPPRWNDAWPPGVATTAPTRSPPWTGDPDRADATFKPVRTPPADGPEVEAAGTVDEDGDVEVAPLVAYRTCGSGPGQDRPVHPADIVAWLVGSRLAGLDAVAEHDRGMAAVSAADHLRPTASSIRRSRAGRSRPARGSDVAARPASGPAGRSAARPGAHAVRPARFPRRR